MATQLRLRSAAVDAEPAVELTLTITTDESAAVVTLAGELEYSTAGTLRSTLLELAHGDASAVVLDMADVAFLDSTGISLLIQAKQRFDERGATVKLRHPSPRVSRVLEIAGVADLFDIER
jgi:anti-anti-sigma factor